MCAFDYVALNLQIFAGKICRRRIVCVDTAYLCRRQDHDVRSFLLKETLHGALVCQIQFSVRTADDMGISFSPQGTDNCASYQPSVPRHINFICFFYSTHIWFPLAFCFLFMAGRFIFPAAHSGNIFHVLFDHHCHQAPEINFPLPSQFLFRFRRVAP